jgi:hypothetical protein
VEKAVENFGAMKRDEKCSEIADKKSKAIRTSAKRARENGG